MFELDAAFNDGQLSVYRSDRPIDELMDGMRQTVQDAAEGNTVSDTEELDGNETGDANDVDAQVDAAVDSFEKKVEKLDEDSADEEAESQTDDRPTCQYCGDTFDPRGLNRHEQRCDENPDNTTDEMEISEDTAHRYRRAFREMDVADRARVVAALAAEMHNEIMDEDEDGDLDGK